MTDGQFSMKKLTRLFENLRRPPSPPILGCPLCGVVHTARVLEEHMRIYNKMRLRDETVA